MPRNHLAAKHRSVMTIAVGILIFILSSCSTALSFDPHELASILATSDLFCDSVHAVDDNLAKILYGLDGESVTLAAYAGSGMTPEAVLIVQCDNEDEAQRIALFIHDYNERQIRIFDTFNPQYRYEVEEAVLEVRETYVIYVASMHSEEAQSLMEKYFDSLQ